MKPENVFISAVHRHLPDWIHREKTNNPYRRGMPDVYYEASGASLWLEYKWLVKPVNAIHPNRLLTPNQLQWLRRAYSNKQNVAVVIGAPKVACLLADLSWEAEELHVQWQKTIDITNWIVERITVQRDTAYENRSSRSAS